MGDPEIEAMSTVATALAGLEENAQGRVLRWAAERYGTTMPTGSRRGGGAAGGGADNDDEGAGDVRPEVGVLNRPLCRKSRRSTPLKWRGRRLSVWLRLLVRRRPVIAVGCRSTAVVGYTCCRY